MDPDPSATPLFSLVSAVHGVEDYLPEFLASLDAQTVDHRSFELVAVIDGSPDRSQAVVERWQQTTDIAVTVVQQANQGQGAARNAGLELARGTWVGFPDPDDVLSPDYLEHVAAGIRAHPEAAVVACRLVMRRDAVGEVTEDHPLDHRFAGGTTLRDLTEDPGMFFVSVPSGFYRRSLVERWGLRFDVRLRPNFEDGHFGARYLLGLDRPAVLFVREARYAYRKRADGSSTQQTSIAHPGRWTTVFRLGYLDLLRRAVADRGAVPAWLSQLVMYELGWLLRPWVRALSDTEPALVAVQEEFHEVMRELAPLVDTSLATAWEPRFTQVWRDVVRRGWADEPWHSPRVRVVRHDPDQGLVCLAFHTSRALRSERWVLGAEEVAPAASTTKPFRVMGRAALVERFAWVPLDDRGLRVELDGLPVPFDVPGEPGQPVVALRPDDVPAAARVARRVSYPPGDPRRRTALLARSAPVRRLFADAWVLMDRVHDADDNAERLFEHLREHRPDVNAWFVVERDTPAWHALRRRHGRRVVAHGSRRWRLLMLNATHLLSSHADPGVMRPSSLVRPGEGVPWRFTFLQHGVIKDDLSTWLNPKAIDLFVVSTPDERDSVLGEDTNYVFTSREVVLTGLPRFDRLLRRGEGPPAPERDLVLVTPTWRSWLTEPMAGDSQRREVRADFASSEFLARWVEVLRSDDVRRAAERHHARLAFWPHPNLRAAVADVDLPEHVWVPGAAEADVQGMLARTRVMLTDYSSMAFNAAYLGRPTVYYQFDRARVLGGDHVGTRGYFGYDTHGFGPVVDDLAALGTELERLLGAAEVPDTYARRMREAFPTRDGRCCERVVEAVEASTRPVHEATGSGSGGGSRGRRTRRVRAGG